MAVNEASAGGIIYPIIFQKTEIRIGFGWATRIIGFVMLAIPTLPILAMRPRAPPTAARKLVELALFKDLPCVLVSASYVFGFMGYFIVFFYVQLYALIVCHTSPSLAFYMLSIVNAGSSFGRLVPNYFADFIGPVNIHILFAPCTSNPHIYLDVDQGNGILDCFLCSLRFLFCDFRITRGSCGHRGVIQPNDTWARELEWCLVFQGLACWPATPLQVLSSILEAAGSRCRHGQLLYSSFQPFLLLQGDAQRLASILRGKYEKYKVN